MAKLSEAGANGGTLRASILSPKPKDLTVQGVFLVEKSHALGGIHEFGTLSGKRGQDIKHSFL